MVASWPQRYLYLISFFLLNTVIDPHYDMMHTCQLSSFNLLFFQGIWLEEDILPSDTHIIYKLKSDQLETSFY